MKSELTKTNEGLVEHINALQAQVDKLEKQLDLCVGVIKEFGHFVPHTMSEFQKELVRIDEVNDEDGAISEQVDYKGQKLILISYQPYSVTNKIIFEDGGIVEGKFHIPYGDESIEDSLNLYWEEISVLRYANLKRDDAPSS